jgi:hypothetical protein
MESLQPSTRQACSQEIYWELFHKYNIATKINADNVKVIAEHARVITKHANIQQVVKHPNLRWIWSMFVNHKYITTDMIFEHEKLPWRFFIFYARQAFTVRDFDIYLKKFEKHLECIAGNMNCDINRILCKYPDLEWDYGALSLNRNITIFTVQKLGRKPWKWENLMFSQITWELLKVVPAEVRETVVHNHHHVVPNDIFKQYCLKMSSLPRIGDNMNIPILDILKDDKIFMFTHPTQLSRRADITLDIVKENLHRTWDWEALTLNPNIEIPVILQNANLPWVLNVIRRRPDFTEKFIKDIPMVYDQRASSSSYAAYILDKFPNECWETLIHNPHIPMSMIMANEHKIKWHWFWSLRRTDIIDSDIEDRPSLWNWETLTTTLPARYIALNKNFKWEYEKLYKNETIDDAALTEYPHLFHGSLILAKNISLQFILRNEHLKWNWVLLASREHL